MVTCQPAKTNKKKARGVVWYYTFIYMVDDVAIYYKILKDRGLTKGEIEEFLNPEYNEDRGGMYDVSKMKDIDKVTDRIWKAVENNEKICVYADYDADGVPAAVIVSEFFKKIKYGNIIIKIPHRHKDGFGLHTHLIDEIKEEGATLLITFDLGITNVKEVDYANKIGVDIIITDHHLPGEKLPEAFAILNPKQDGCMYGEKMLCGSGVAYKLIHRLVAQARSKGYGISVGWEKWLLDLVGLATLSDMVPLVGENRVFAVYGLRVLQKARRPGLSSLLSEMKINPRDLQEDDIGFSISPCINAASRMSHAMDAFHTLACDNSAESVKLAKGLVNLNVSRKAKAQLLVASADSKVDPEDAKAGVLVFGDESWSPTLVGPIASSMVRKFQVPVFVYGCEDGEVYRGSCRSVAGVSVVDIMSHIEPGFFVECGGHAMSGGFAFSKEKVSFFKEKLKEAFRKVKDAVVQDVGVAINKNPVYTITHDKVTDSLLEDLRKLKPFGVGNEKPEFRIDGVVIREIKKFGKTKEHAEFVVDSFMDTVGEIQKARPDFLKDVHTYSDRHKRIAPVKYISFFTEDDLWNAPIGQLCDIYGRIEESFFLGKREIRVRVEKIVSKV